MRTLTMWMLISTWAIGTVGCHDDNDDPTPKAGSAASSKIAPVGVEQIAPPLDLTRPPADAAKTGSGLSYKLLVANKAGAQPKPTETALVQYTGWIQRTGATFFTTRGQSQPIALDIAHVAPGFAEALQLLHKGEKAVLWVPPSDGTPEAMVYELEVIDVIAPPAVASRATAEERVKAVANGAAAQERVPAGAEPARSRNEDAHRVVPQP